jgi:hypothetical protein
MLTNFVTIPTPPRNASSLLPTLQASTEYFDFCSHFADPNSVNMQIRCFVISWTKRKATMLSAERHRSLVQNVPNPGRSELQLVDFKSTTMFRVSSVSTTEDDNFVTTCNVTFYLKQNLNRLSSSLTHSKYF